MQTQQQEQLLPYTSDSHTMVRNEYVGKPMMGTAYTMTPYAHLQAHVAAPPLAPGAVFAVPQLAMQNAHSSKYGPGTFDSQKKSGGKRRVPSECSTVRNAKRRTEGGYINVCGQDDGHPIADSDTQKVSSDLKTTGTSCIASANSSSTARFCEACEKEFASTAAWEAHVATHDTCPYPGCQFSATKKIVGAHWQLAHGQYSGNGLKEIEVEVGLQEDFQGADGDLA